MIYMGLFYFREWDDSIEEVHALACDDGDVIMAYATSPATIHRVATAYFFHNVVGALPQGTTFEAH